MTLVWNNNYPQQLVCFSGRLQHKEDGEQMEGEMRKREMRGRNQYKRERERERRRENADGG